MRFRPDHAPRSATVRIKPHSTDLIDLLEPRMLLAAGGGWTSAGLAGEYFNNTSLTGPAAFTRRDVRLDFDWAATYKPGGSLALPYSSLGTDNYSIRWTGQLVPAYSETYTFKASADDVFTLRIKPSGGTAWTAIINQTSYTGADSIGAFTFTAGQKYDALIEYKEFTGNAHAKLRWSSFSTPESIIEPLQNNGYLVDGRARWMFADVVKTAPITWRTPDSQANAPMDSNGWPTADAGLMVWEGESDPIFGGTFNVRFTGRAAVASPWVYGVKFIPAGSSTQYDSLAMGQGWNSGSNTTEFRMIVPTTSNSPIFLRFTSTRRLGTDTTSTGITNLQMLRPRTPGGNDPYPFGTIYADDFKAAADVFTVYRWLDTNGNLGESSWADRVRPTYGTGMARGGDVYGDGKVNKGWIYEYQIMFANETGRDLYLTVPMRATNDYFTQLARLVRYGSDANGTPYTSPVSNPVYPPLNPNLKVYLEVSNEVWNFAGGFEQTRQADDDAVAASQAAAGSALRAEWDIVNYDNSVSTSDTGGWNTFDFKRLSRWYVLRGVRMSEAFRSVYGDAGMSAVRPMFFWQYNDANETASYELKFLNDYFNNGDGLSHVPTPRAPNYHFWAAGGASYYGSGNPQGTLAVDPIVNPSFDTNSLPSGQATPRPSITGWSFSGNAGVYKSGGSSYNSDGKSMGALPAPSIGNSAAYIVRGGQVTQDITFTKSGIYAIGFTARSKSNYPLDGSSPFPIDVFVNGVRVTPKYRAWEGSGEPDAATSAQPIAYGWNRNIANEWVTLLTTAAFEVTIPAGQTSVTLPFQIGNPDSASGATDWMLFDKFYIASADRVYDAGIPDTGEALGQTADGPWAQDRREIAEYAQAYGLRVAAYESGWSLGGDSGSSPFQNWLKYYDPRTRIANNVAIDVHDQAGYSLVTYGVYSQWDDNRIANAANSELRKSFADKNKMLPAGLLNALAVPVTLTPANQSVSQDTSWPGWNLVHNANSTLTKNEWMSWNLNIADRGRYDLITSTGAGGTAQVSVDNVSVASFTSGSPQTTRVTLMPGLHSIRIRSAGTNSFSITSIAVQSVADAVPAVQSFTVNDGNAQRSMISTLSVTFTEAVTLSSAITLLDRTGALLPGITCSATATADPRVHLIGFMGAGMIVGGSLPDGLYRLRLAAANVSDSTGQPMKLDASFSFHRLFGDIDGDRDVDRVDLNVFKSRLNRPTKYVWYLDYDDNDRIDPADLLQIKARMNRTQLL